MKPRFDFISTLLILTLMLLSSAAQVAKANELLFSLNGSWHFTPDRFANEQQAIKADFRQWDRLAVPGNWDTTEKYANYRGKAYYQKSFMLPTGWAGKNLRLKFDAVYQTAKVWLNGHYLGSHNGGYTPFEFTISDYVDKKGANSLLVMADNSYHRGAWWPWGGISRDVTLFADDVARIVYQHINAVPDFEQQKVDFEILYQLQNYSDQPLELAIESQLAGQNYRKSVLLKNKQQAVSHQFSLPLSQVNLWDLNSPYLYTASSRLTLNNQLIDQKVDEFGIRKIAVVGEKILLNNREIRLNGLNRVHDHPVYGNTEPADLVAADMQDLKTLGARFSRLMHAPLAKNILQWCDRNGYLLVQEIPVWGDDDPQTFANNPVTKGWLDEMIKRDFNHPSVIGWSVGNELRDPAPPWGKKTLTDDQFAYVESMLEHLDTLDPNRLKTYVSLTAFSSLANKTNEPFDKLDFISINSYGNLLKKVASTHKNFPGKPIFVSEVGTKQIGAGESADLDEALLSDLRQLKSYPYVVGFSLWSYNDYRSDYKGTPESGFRAWGVVDEQRNKKAAYFSLQKLFEYWAD
ncbi:glycoside hydrolase family 2 protein [Gayadomonas joobiniege]|uniref:glycoside hydrolase family 2 protein n=1 Tax=Gayadomonas joobiniege TaxID=1234606 RepID=UPI00036ECAD0|nr:glycoside hydrolase family 2 [Gayadomonas joobiniege]